MRLTLLPWLLMVFLLGAHLFADGVRSGSFLQFSSRGADVTVNSKALERRLLQEQQPQVSTDAADGNLQKKAHSKPEVKQESKAEGGENNVEPKVAEGKKGQANENEKKSEHIGGGEKEGKVESKKKGNTNAEDGKRESKEAEELKAKHEAKTEEAGKGNTVAVESFKSEGTDGAKPDGEKQEKQSEKKDEHKKAIEKSEVREKKQDSKLEEEKKEDQQQKTQGKQDAEKGDHKKELNLEKRKDPQVKVQIEEAPVVEEKKELPENKEEREKEKSKETLIVEESSKEGLQVEENKKEGREVQATEEESKPKSKEELNKEEEVKVEEKKQEPNIDTKKTSETKVEALENPRGFEKAGEPKEHVGRPQSESTKRAEMKGEESPSGKHTKEEERESQSQNEKQKKRAQEDHGNDAAKTVPTQEVFQEAKRHSATKVEVEDLNGYTPGTTDLDDSDEDYPDFLEELRNFPERFHKTAEIVKDHIKYSGLDRYSTHSKELFNQANHQIEERFTPLLGKDYAPFVAYMISYGLLLLPLVLVMYFLERVRATLSLQKILLLVSLYLSAYFGALMAATFVLDSEPMNFFMKYSTSGYIFLQLLQAFGYLVYLLLSTVDLVSSCSTGRFAAKVSSALQFLVVVAVGFHYYVTVFHRAMERKAPITTWKIYGLYSVSFCCLHLFAKVERGKKQYIPAEQDDTTDKKN